MQSISTIHKKEYGCKADVISYAPCRIHLLGEHSWFFKDKTLSMAVNLPVFVALSKRQDPAVKVFFVQENERKRASIATPKIKRDGRWLNDVMSVLFGYSACGFILPTGFDITIYSEKLCGAGFGVSSAIKVAVALAMQKILSCSEKYILMALERGAREFLKQNFFRHDVYAILYAQKNCVMITDHSTRTFENIPFPFLSDSGSGIDKKIFLIDTNVPRAAMWRADDFYDEPENALLLGDLREERNSVYGGWAYVKDKNDINETLSVASESSRKKLLCIIREHRDLLEIYDAIGKDDFSKFCRLVNDSQENLRELYDISCAEINWLTKRIMDVEPNLEYLQHPVSCARLTGKGFSRSIYAFLRERDVETFKSRLVEFERIFSFKPECVEISSADGAGILQA